MSQGWNWVLLIAGALLVLVEVALGGFAGFDLVLIGSSLVLGGGLGLLFGNTTVGYVTAAVLCLGYVALGRRWVRSRMAHRAVASNADALVGARALVTERIERHHAGMVKVRGEVWRALPASDDAGPFDAGVEVTVAAVDGVTLQVR
jgi:membrane protein implicated in regulation of membrane protease activity